MYRVIWLEYYDIDHFGGEWDDNYMEFDNRQDAIDYFLKLKNRKDWFIKRVRIFKELEINDISSNTSS